MSSPSPTPTPAPVLYAEDDANDVFFLRRAFQAAGIDNPIEVARDGQEAADYLARAGSGEQGLRLAWPCLFILDLKMPRLSGLEVLAWLRQKSHLPRVPVIVFSSSAFDRDVEEAFALGANAFVVKPGSVADRLSLARCIKDFWLRFNQPVPALGAAV